MRIINPLTSFLHLPKRVKFLLLGLFLLAFFLIIISQISKLSGLEVIKTSPVDGTEAVDSFISEVSINFNQPLENINLVQLNIYPSLKTLSRLSQDQQSLIIEPQEVLRPNKTYTLDLVELKSKKTLVSFSFKTQVFESEENYGRGDPGLVAKVHKKDQENFPLLRWVPYSAEDFEADYLGPLKLEVKIKTNQEKAKSGVEAWLKSHGIDPESHEIIFVAL